MMGKTIRSISFDAKKIERAKKKDKFQSSKSAEKEFYRALKRVAQKSGHLIDIHADGAELKNERQLLESLERYSKQLEPWARRRAEKMLAQVSKSNKRSYERESKTVGKELRNGKAMKNDFKVSMALLNEQVALIQSIPLEAGMRAQKIAAENFLNGRRAVPDPEIISNLRSQMGMSTEVAINRAKLIARTETARANASFVQARAAAIGSEGYIWRTTMDGAERDSHARMNGKYFRYDSPPHLSDGTTGHAGTFPNCRCWQDPVLPETVE